MLKQPVIPLLLLMFIGLLTQLIFAQSQTNERIVFATSLVMRDGPSGSKAAVDTLVYGDKVKILKKGSDFTLGTIKDNWYQIQFGETVGYVFGAFILPVPAPDLSAGGTESFLNLLEQISKPDTIVEKGLITISYHYNYGVSHKMFIHKMAYGDFSEWELQVAGLSVYQGFLLARAIVSQDGIESSDMKRWAKIEVDRNGNHYLNEDTGWQIIYVSEINGGVNISFPERAD